MGTRVTCTTINVLNTNNESIKIFPMKFSLFTAKNNLCILHGQVFVIEKILFSNNSLHEIGSATFGDGPMMSSTLTR